MKPDTNIQIPIKGQKILLRGFEASQEAEARHLLAECGYQIVTSIALADALIVGKGNAAPAVEAAHKAKIMVSPWTDFCSRMEGAVSQPPSWNHPSNWQSRPVRIASKSWTKCCHGPKLTARLSLARTNSAISASMGGFYETREPLPWASAMGFRSPWKARRQLPRPRSSNGWPI